MRHFALEKVLSATERAAFARFVQQHNPTIKEAQEWIRGRGHAASRGGTWRYMRHINRARLLVIEVASRLRRIERMLESALLVSKRGGGAGNRRHGRATK